MTVNHGAGGVVKKEEEPWHTAQGGFERRWHGTAPWPLRDARDCTMALGQGVAMRPVYGLARWEKKAKR